MKALNFLILIIFITGCTSCDKLKNVGSGYENMPDIIEVEIIDDNINDIIFSDLNYSKPYIMGINIETEKTYKINLKEFLVYDITTFKEGFIVYLDRGSFSLFFL